MRFAGALLIAIGTASAQTAAITSPAANAVMSDYQFTFTSTCTGCTTIYSAEYDVDGELAGITRDPGYSYVWDPVNVGNGIHVVTVTYRDALNQTIASSSGVSFQVEYNLPQNTCPPNGAACADISVAVASTAQINVPSSIGWIAQLISFHGSGAVVVAGTPLTGTSANSTLNLPSFTSTATHTLAVFARVQSSSQNLAVSDNKGDTFSCLTTVQTGSIGGGWCYAKNIAGGSSTIITVTSSGGAQVVMAYSYELAGASTTSPLDLTVSNTNALDSSQNPRASFTLGFPAANELVLFGASFSGALTATAGPGYTLIQDSTRNAAVESISPSANWFSIMSLAVTARGDNAATLAKTFQVNVDGLLAFSSTQGGSNHPASSIVYFDTSQYSNTTHNVVVTVTAGNCPNCTNGAWNIYGQWEQQQLFTNAALATELRANYREAILCVASAANCPSTLTLTGTLYNTDGSTIPVTPNFAGNDESVATVSSGGLVTAVANGVTKVTLTSGNESRTVWIYVVPFNTIPHFSKQNGAILSAYDPANSIWHASLFNAGSGFKPYANSPFPYADRLAAAYKAGGYNTIEFSITQPGTNEAAYHTQALTDVNLYLGYMHTYGLCGHTVGDSVIGGAPVTYNVTYGPWANFSPPAVTYFYQLLQGECITGGSMVDEVSNKIPSSPLRGTDTGGIKLGTNGLSQISCVNGGLCTVAYTGWGVSTAGTFIIIGSGDPNLDYNTTSGTPPLYSATKIDNNTFTFPTPPGVGTKIYTAAANPNLEIEQFVVNTYDANAITQGAITSTTCLNGGTSPGPCPEFMRGDSMLRFRTQITNVPNHAPITFPSLSGVHGLAEANWCKTVVNGVKMSDYCESYWSNNGPTYLGTFSPLTSLLANGSQGDSYRRTYQDNDLASPTIDESSGITLDYLKWGRNAAVASCSGSTITTSQPHGVTTILPDLARIQVSGSTGCDGNYYIIRAPTANTLFVAQAQTTVPHLGVFGATGGTLTFEDGTVFTNTGIDGHNNDNNPASMNTNGGTCPNNLANHRGQIFQINGTNQASFNGAWGVYMPDTLGGCPGSVRRWRQIPTTLSSTGGSANIITDNYYVRGRSWQTNTESGPRLNFATDIYAFILGAAGIRSYAYGFDTQGYDADQVNANEFYSAVVQGNDNFPPFNDFNGTGNTQGPMNPITDIAKSRQNFMAHGHANLLAERLLPYAFQARLPAPDYGQFYETSARTGPAGNLLMIQSFVDNTVSCTADLSPYLIAGKPVIRITSTWTGIEPIATLPAGTASDTMTCQPGEFRAYLFLNNAATEVPQPRISVRVADVPSAAKVLIQFSYSPIAFQDPYTMSQMHYLTFDCGAGSCTLPVDPRIGTIYYRLLYLNNAGALLATSDVQNL